MINQSIERYKTWLKTKGFTQNYRFDYLKISVPDIIQVFLSIAPNIHWFLHQLDVKNDILDGGLNEEAYIEHHQGFKRIEKIEQLYK